MEYPQTTEPKINYSLQTETSNLCSSPHTSAPASRTGAQRLHNQVGESSSSLNQDIGQILKIFLSPTRAKPANICCFYNRPGLCVWPRRIWLVDFEEAGDWRMGNSRVASTWNSYVPRRGLHQSWQPSWSSEQNRGHIYGSKRTAGINVLNT